MSIPDPAVLAATYCLWRSRCELEQVAIAGQLDQQALLITQAEVELSLLRLQQAQVQLEMQSRQLEVKRLEPS